MKRIRLLQITVLTLLGLVNSQWAAAQNVTIKATNGSTIAAVKNGGATDTFFGAGGFATWQHEQLSMVLTTSDGTALTPNQQLDNPANNLFTSGNHMQIAKGQADGANVCYVSLSLPKGYRFTGYNIVFSKSNETKGSGNGAISFDSPVTSRFGETGSDFSSYTIYDDVTNGGGTGEISRHEMSEGEMGNVLYFKLINTTEDNSGYWDWGWVSTANNRALITLESAEFFFTAEENYSPVTPAGTIDSPVSAVDIPFSTSKVDYGNVQNRKYTINGIDYWRMSYSSADVSDLEANFVLYEGDVKDKDGNVTYTTLKDGADIDGTTGKVVEYKSGSISSAGGYFKLGNADREQIYYIETPTYVTLSDNTKNPVGYRITGAEFDYTTSVLLERTFYITYTYNGTKRYLNTEGRYTQTPVIWEIDNDGYISSNGNYLYFNNGYATTQREKPGETERFAIDSSNHIYQVGWSDYFICGYRGGRQGNRVYYCLITPDDYTKAQYEEISYDGANTGSFTLNVYDKTGKSIEETVAVNGKGKVTLTGLNNDAVKFGVQGIGLVRATLTMQALDPYLNSMDVVCLDNQLEKPITMSQTFTASDFSVSGGEFYFYLPSSCAGHTVGITFENLKSDYFDESYSGGNTSHTSRINFVKSLHYNAFGATNNNVYTNTSEASDAKLERLKVGTVGSAAFKFNNADVVGNSGGTLTEYPFSLEKYAAAPNNGSFGSMEFTVSADDQHQTKYVFTTDETRYNIAPTTATQHRAYAFYEMTVHVQTQTYEPKVEFTKIYDHTLYGTGQDKAFYGAKVTAYEDNTTDHPGYSSITDIFTKINNAIKAGKDDKGNTCTDLKDVSQLLYLDLSEMAGIYQMSDNTGQSVDDFTGIGAKNFLVFIPAGTSSSNNNVAYKTGGSAFMAARDIILTDKEPFYSPHDIQVAAANKVEYKRLITLDKYGKTQNASLIVPFAVKVDGGTHTNPDGSSFSLHTMQERTSLTLIGGTTYAYFPELSDVNSTEANKPYLVQLSENSSEDGVCFVVSQTGALIKATTGMGADYTFTGETSTGTATAGEAQGNYTFVSKGTYAGAKIAKDNSVFYFARNHFVNSANLNAGYSDVKIAPFRAYFSSSADRNAKLASFDVIFGEGVGDVPTGLQAVEAADVVDMDAPVYDLQGRLVATSYRELTRKKVQKGMYVVNGVKIMIK